MIKELWAKLTAPSPIVQARVLPTWKANRPLPSPEDIMKLDAEGYRTNALVAGCIWAIATSASEPVLRVKQRQADGSLEEAKGASADALRALLERPNPEDTTFTFLEKLFTNQQVSGNWFVQKLRARSGAPVQLWSMNPGHIKIVPGSDGWVSRYDYNGRGVSAQDVIHDKLHPPSLSSPDEFWGLSPIAVAARYIDLDNSAGEFLRGFFQNNATPAGILKLKAQVERVERQRIKELWKSEHTGPNAWSVSVLDADAEYQVIGADGNKLQLGETFAEAEARICGSFGVPAIIAGAVIGLSRSTFANYAEARKSFWQDTLSNLYKRCGQRLTHGLAFEFGSDLVIEFDLSTVEALQEHRQDVRAFAMGGWGAGLLTKNEARELLGLPPIPDGDVFKSASTPENLLTGETETRLLPHEHHGRSLTKREKKAMKEIRKVVSAHFAEQSDALIRHLQSKG